MSLFEFISGMVSLIIALAIAQLLVSVGRVAQHHRRVRPYLPHTFWNLSIFLIAFLHWWSLWDFRDLEWNSGMFFYSLGGPLLLFFSVTLLNPDVSRDDSDIDLEAHFRRVRVLFLSAFLAALLFFTFDGPLFGTEPLFNILRATQLVFAVCIVGSLVSDRTPVQIVFSLITVSLLIYVSVIRYLPGMVG